MSIRLFSFFLFVLVLSANAQAAISPLSVGFAPPIQFPPSDFSVTGARINLIYGQHRDVYGLDLGVIGNITDQSFAGIGVAGVFNLTRGHTTVLGLQAAGITNINTDKTHVYGVQLASALNINKAASSVTGLQVAVLGNLSPFTSIYGAQVGLYNRAQRVYGFQIGLVNVTDSLHGIQIGLVNFHRKGLFAVSPILNIGF